MFSIHFAAREQHAVQNVLLLKAIRFDFISFVSAVCENQDCLQVYEVTKHAFRTVYDPKLGYNTALILCV